MLGLFALTLASQVRAAGCMDEGSTEPEIGTYNGVRLRACDQRKGNCEPSVEVFSKTPKVNPEFVHEMPAVVSARGTLHFFEVDRPSRATCDDSANQDPLRYRSAPVRTWNQAGTVLRPLAGKIPDRRDVRHELGDPVVRRPVSVAPGARRSRRRERCRGVGTTAHPYRVFEGTDASRSCQLRRGDPTHSGGGCTSQSGPGIIGFKMSMRRLRWSSPSRASVVPAEDSFTGSLSATPRLERAPRPRAARRASLRAARSRWCSAR